MKRKEGRKERKKERKKRNEQNRRAGGAAEGAASKPAGNRCRTEGEMCQNIAPPADSSEILPFTSFTTDWWHASDDGAATSLPLSNMKPPFPLI